VGRVREKRIVFTDQAAGDIYEAAVVGSLFRVDDAMAWPTVFCRTVLPSCTCTDGSCDRCVVERIVCDRCRPMPPPVRAAFVFPHLPKE